MPCLLLASAIVFGVLSQVCIANADELSDASATVESAQKTYDDAVARQSELQQQIQAISDQLPLQKEASDTALKDMYDASNNELGTMIHMLTSQSSLTDILRAMDYRFYLAEQRTNAVLAAQNSMNKLEQAKSEQDVAVAEAEQAKNDASSAYDKAKAAADARTKTSNVKAAATDNSSESGSWNTGYMTLSELKFRGVVRANGYRYTYYSESVLPGYGLSIPGRHHENGLVVDGDGYVCVASSDLSKGTVVPTPLGDGKVYDSGCASGTIDIYIA